MDLIFKKCFKKSNQNYLNMALIHHFFFPYQCLNVNIS